MKTGALAGVQPVTYCTTPATAAAPVPGWITPDPRNKELAMSETAPQCPFPFLHERGECCGEQPCSNLNRLVPLNAMAAAAAAADLRPQIAGELYKAVAKLTDDPELLSIIGSYGDTLEDSEILQLLIDFNATGSVFERVLADVDKGPDRTH